MTKDEIKERVEVLFESMLYKDWMNDDDKKEAREMFDKIFVEQMGGWDSIFEKIQEGEKKCSLTR